MVNIFYSLLACVCFHMSQIAWKQGLATISVPQCLGSIPNPLLEDELLFGVYEYCAATNPY